MGDGEEKERVESLRTERLEVGLYWVLVGLGKDWSMVESLRRRVGVGGDDGISNR